MKVKEIWLPVTIKPYDKYYQVSNMGRVRSLDKIINFNTKKGLKKGRILNLNKGRHYLHVTLSHKQLYKTITVHYLVASAFIPNPDKKPTVNHKKGNKLDNRASQLEWATRSEQMMHAINVLNFKPTPPPNPGIGSAHNRSRAVLQYTLNDRLVSEYGSTRQAAVNTGFNQSAIAYSSRTLKNYKGYKWAYKQ